MRDVIFTERDFYEYYINDLYTTHAVVCWVTAITMLTTTFVIEETKAEWDGLVLLDLVLVGRAGLWHRDTAMVDNSVCQRTHDRTINVAHEDVAAEEWSDLCLLEQVIIVRQPSGDRRVDVDNARSLGLR
jgi:hypothetical protein